MTADLMDQPTGAGEPLAADEIHAMRERIDEIDQAIIDLWLERARLSQQVGKHPDGLRRHPPGARPASARSSSASARPSARTAPRWPC